MGNFSLNIFFKSIILIKVTACCKCQAQSVSSDLFEVFVLWITCSCRLEFHSVVSPFWGVWGVLLNMLHCESHPPWMSVTFWLCGRLCFWLHCTCHLYHSQATSTHTCAFNPSYTNNPQEHISHPAWEHPLQDYGTAPGGPLGHSLRVELIVLVTKLVATRESRDWRVWPAPFTPALNHLISGSHPSTQPHLPSSYLLKLMALYLPWNKLWSSLCCTHHGRFATTHERFATALLLVQTMQTLWGLASTTILGSPLSHFSPNGLRDSSPTTESKTWLPRVSWRNQVT